VQQRLRLLHLSEESIDHLEQRGDPLRFEIACEPSSSEREARRLGSTTSSTYPSRPGSHNEDLEGDAFELLEDA